MNNKITYKTLCLLEELNDVLYEGKLEYDPRFSKAENDAHLKEIVYQCQRLIDITE